MPATPSTAHTTPSLPVAARVLRVGRGRSLPAACFPLGDGLGPQRGSVADAVDPCGRRRWGSVDPALDVQPLAGRATRLRGRCPVLDSSGVPWRGLLHLHLHLHLHVHLHVHVRGRPDGAPPGPWTSLCVTSRSRRRRLCGDVRSGGPEPSGGVAADEHSQQRPGPPGTARTGRAHLRVDRRRSSRPVATGPASRWAASTPSNSSGQPSQPRNGPSTSASSTSPKPRPRPAVSQQTEK